jgi:hypothetical protein
MKTPDRYLLSFIIVSVLILVIGYISGSEIIQLRNDGALDRWEDFSAPRNADKIVDATSYLLWIETVDGSIYQGNAYCQQNSDCLQQWQEVESVPTDLPRAGEMNLKRDGDCNFGDFPAMTQPPKDPVECVRAQFRGPEYGSIIYYTIFKDGTLATLKHSASDFEDSFTRVSSIFLSLVVCMILLFVINAKLRRNAGVLVQTKTG